MSTKRHSLLLKAAVVAPYVLGLTWILCHPLISVVTGELKCRGVYIDEHQLDPKSYNLLDESDTIGYDKRTLHDISVLDDLSLEKAGRISNYAGEDVVSSATTINTHPAASVTTNDDGQQQKTAIAFDVCSALNAIRNYNYNATIDTDKGTTKTENYNYNNQSHGQQQHLTQLAEILSSQSISCSSSYSAFHIVKIQSKKAPTSPVESIVFVVPPPPVTIAGEINTHDLTLQKSILLMMARIVQNATPYLAKTLIFIFCNDIHDHDVNISNNNYNHDPVRHNQQQRQQRALERGVQEFLVSCGALPLSFSSKFDNNNPYVPSLPSISFDFTKYIIRQLIILDIETFPSTSPSPSSKSQQEQSNQSLLHIIPHGSHGQLPNLDFVTAALYSFQQGYYYNYNSNRYNNMNNFVIHMHTYDRFISWWQRHVVNHYFLNGPSRLKNYFDDLGHMLSFILQSIFQPTTPHSKALSNGIDSLTIRIHLPSDTESSTITNDDHQLMQRNKINTLLYGVEHLLRGINSLQEVLHHSVNQYIMVSDSKFVSFDEYIIPIILIMLPLVLRVCMILFNKVSERGGENVDQSLGTFQFRLCIKCVASSALLSYYLFLLKQIGRNDGGDTFSNLHTGFFCLGFVFILKHTIRSRETSLSSTKSEATIKTASSENDEKQSMQLVSCLMALYIHVPIALVHASLGLISALIWVPLLAFPVYGNKPTKPGNRNALSKVLAVFMLPPVAINVSIRILMVIITNAESSRGLMTNLVMDVIATLNDMRPLYSMYFITGYIPLHFMFSMLSFL